MCWSPQANLPYGTEHQRQDHSRRRRKGHVGERHRTIVDKASATLWRTHRQVSTPDPGIKHINFVRYNPAANTDVSTTS